jgi:Ca2+-binding EF-hand superfamily protein
MFFSYYACHTEKITRDGFGAHLAHCEKDLSKNSISHLASVHPEEPTLNKVEVPELLRYTLVEGSQRFRETEMLQKIYYVRPTFPPQEDTENRPFTMIV